ncbi:MAG: 3-deoxy-D-manno-octulosonic acid transferase [Paraglaciecola sp.]|nr:3-deoxy-D-manno-octulosonic acid transferase [Paraglaciecola sp.]NCT46677.1 3-deoxy-D-manno-octulosonic acid transferase [Paraglaciecola sp.]
MRKPYRPSLPEQFSLFAYTLVWLLLLPFLAVWWLYSRYKHGVNYAAEHLTRFAVLAQVAQKNGFLLHCASVGEVVTMQPVVQQLLKAYPDVAITISTNTLTGRERVRQLYADHVCHMYLPYDLPWFMAKLLRKLQPRMVLITEMELWPNLVHVAWRQAIPVYVVNARMSDKSLRTYQRLAYLTKPLLHKLSGIGAQGQRDLENYQHLGALSETLRLTHNLKFNINIDPQLPDQISKLGQQLNIGSRLVMVAGSTHEPEESWILECFRLLSKDFQDLLLIIVPRHPQRFAEVATLLAEQNMRFVTLSSQQACQDTTQVILGDKMGMLQVLYGLANVAFIGGSIAARGGHNALESAVMGVPAVMGPSTYNNPQICQTLEQAGALVIVNNQQQMQHTLQAWLHDTAARESAGEAGRAVINNNRVALANTLAFLKL